MAFSGKMGAAAQAYIRVGKVASSGHARFFVFENSAKAAEAKGKPGKHHLEVLRLDFKVDSSDEDRKKQAYTAAKKDPRFAGLADC